MRLYTYVGESVFRLHRIAADGVAVKAFSTDGLVGKGNWTGCGACAAQNEKFPSPTWVC
jgi:hypothetical protein